MAYSKDIILYHYQFSPFAKRIVWYLNFRKIPYSQCLQPVTMPRPDIAALGTNYRRIPIVSIGRDIYNDTRLIIAKLETLFPPSSQHPAISASHFNSSPELKALEILIESWVIDAGMFTRGGQLIPSNMPLLRNEKFIRDREVYTGRSWSKENVERGRPEALVFMRDRFQMVEQTLLSDGRDWILGTKEPSLSDIEAVWVFHWTNGLPGALDSNLISPQHFPKVFAWIKRFDEATKAAMKIQYQGGKPPTFNGAKALDLVSNSDFAEAEGVVDGNDPTGFKKGQQVEVWPTDTGFSNKDKGKLLTLNRLEIVTESQTKSGKTVRVHAPRHGFRIAANDGKESSKM
ncbi:hypothetical protein B0J14DRAFT_589717 [Halenospora varia]|nr:hypothetical protein B0J14DRAFT_589717 [Halenospora varia]